MSSMSSVTRVLVDPATGEPVKEVADTRCPMSRPRRHRSGRSAADVGHDAGRRAVAGAVTASPTSSSARPTS